jgi:hypothetical protein
MGNGFVKTPVNRRSKPGPMPTMGLARVRYPPPLWIVDGRPASRARWRTLPRTARRVGRARMQARQRFSPVLPFCPQPPFSPRVNSPCLRVPQNPTSLGRLKCRCHRHRRPRVPESRGTPPSQISASVVLRQATARAGAKQASSCAPPCTSPRPTPIMGIGFAKKAQKQGVEPGANARNEDRARR